MTIRINSMDVLGFVCRPIGQARPMWLCRLQFAFAGGPVGYLFNWMNDNVALCLLFHERDRRERVESRCGDSK
jgi:hypothetical protein